jgi:glucose-1-phosphate thymidylyltransferase
LPATSAGQLCGWQLTDFHDLGLNTFISCVASDSYDFRRGVPRNAPTKIAVHLIFFFFCSLSLLRCRLELVGYLLLMIALILAGGFATRLWPLTEKRAKPLLPLASRPLISHLVEALPGDMEVIVSTNTAFSYDFEQWKKQYPKRNIRIFLEDAVSDTGKPGALAATSLVIDHFKVSEPLLLLAGDNYVGFNMTSFIERYDERPLLAVYDTKSFQQAKQFGVVEVQTISCDADDRKNSCLQVIAFEEKPALPKSTLVSTGCYIFPQRNLVDICEYSKLKADNLGGVFEYLLSKGETIDAFAFDEQWIDIGSFSSYIQAHRSLQTQSTTADSSTVMNSTLGSGVNIGEFCVIEDCILENVLIMSGCKLRNSRLRDCIVDTNCIIEGLDLEHKMIRSGFESISPQPKGMGYVSS